MPGGERIERLSQPLAHCHVLALMNRPVAEGRYGITPAWGGQPSFALPAAEI